MFQSLKRSWLVLLLLVAGAQSLFGFALQGPLAGSSSGPASEAWQDPTLGMSLIPSDEGFFDIGTPKNVAQGYRWNTRNIYYAFDASFITYFGSDGAAAAAVDKAFAVLNSLTNFSAYPFDLPDEPLNTVRINHRAQALGLIDIKSLTLSTLLSELGLAEPKRYTWNVKIRDTRGATCPNYSYLVVQRNYDPSSENMYSTYVNGTIYTYLIEELCGITPAPAGRVLSEAFEYKADPLAATDSAVADLLSEYTPGVFYTGLTRDDVAGLKYLMDTNRVNWENVSTNSLLVVTNNSFTNLVTSNFATLYAQARTNGPNTLLTLFPGLVITDFTQDFTTVVTTNVTAYFTNYPYSSAGSLASAVVVTNRVTNAIPIYKYVFGNVVTNLVFTHGAVTTQVISNGVPPYSPVGTPPQFFTNNITQNFSFVGGEYFLLPTNALCGFTIVSNLFSDVITVTNLVTVATNAPSTTNSSGLSFTETILTYFTNHNYKVLIPQCVTNGGGAALRAGVDKLNFIRRDFQTLLSPFWPAITNTYSLVLWTNNGPTLQTLQRVVTRPDILFSAADLSIGPGGAINSPIVSRSVPNYNLVNAPAPGPGTIDPQVSIVFNTVGPNFIVPGPFFVDAGLGLARTPEGSGFKDFLYGSFDGTTNAPVIYPNWISLNNLENQLFLQIIMSGPLAIGHVGVAYSAEIQVSGSQPPFTWTLAPQSAGLPPGLNPPVSSGTNTAVIAGMPTTPGIYDFDIQVQDAGGRTTQRNFTIEIAP
ncbi:MAG: Ig family protein [Pedosphaera sp.]|nr:Ig family protein [Pedosphaera sp.]